MKVFISHAFGGEDERLGGILKGDLEAAGMDGYMAERTPKYNLLIADKIMREIGGSDWLVAIITNRGHESASVHEEIGYALGRGVEVVLMLRNDVEEAGVLVHGREPLIFTPDEFKKHSLEVVEFIRNAPAPGPRHSRLSEMAEALLADRAIASAESPLFAANKHFARLHSPVPSNAEKPVALFTACPHELADGNDVTSKDFVEWVESTTHIEVDGKRLRVPCFDPRVDIDALYVAEKYGGASATRNILAYREFLSNGFYELGTSYIFFGRNNGRMKIHLCYMVGEFWAFLAYTRLFYKKIGLNTPFTVLFSIRNARKLALGNFGDNADNRESDDLSGAVFPRIDPTTGHVNIQRRYVFRPASEVTDDCIARTAKKAAKDICNAYGEITPRCYNADGKFSWSLWDGFSQVAMKGGRL